MDHDEKDHENKLLSSATFTRCLKFRGGGVSWTKNPKSKMPFSEGGGATLPQTSRPQTLSQTSRLPPLPQTSHAQPTPLPPHRHLVSHPYHRHLVPHPQTWDVSFYSSAPASTVGNFLCLIESQIAMRQFDQPDTPLKIRVATAQGKQGI